MGDHAQVLAFGFVFDGLPEQVHVPFQPRRQHDHVTGGGELGGQDPFGLDRADAVEQPRPTDRGVDAEGAQSRDCAPDLLFTVSGGGLEPPRPNTGTSTSS